VVGYAVFRGSNLEKNLFRTDPTDPRVKHLKYLPTERGTKLLISGWWVLVANPRASSTAL
jgi:delta14-sterol reductase